MDYSKLGLLFHTLKYLRFKQIYYRGFYFVRNLFFKKEYNKPLNKKIQPLNWEDSFLYNNSYKPENSFTFLNLSHAFEVEIDWNFSGFGKLWIYNLNYFDFLNQNSISSDDGLRLIEDYIKKNPLLKDGKEPYPISLRGTNWIKFLSRNSIIDSNIDQTLYNHYQILFNNLEYHLLGNHLLER